MLLATPDPWVCLSGHPKQLDVYFRVSHSHRICVSGHLQTPGCAFLVSLDPPLHLSGYPMTSSALRHGFLEGEGQAQPQVPAQGKPAQGHGFDPPAKKLEGALKMCQTYTEKNISQDPHLIHI